MKRFAWRRLLAGATLVAFVLPLLAACTTVAVPTETEAAPAGPIQGAAWTEASSADGIILNPILAGDSASFDMMPYFPGLLGINPKTGAVEATEMAESWTVSEDSLVWTFNLRPGVTWSDGEAVDAHDFKFTYDAIASELVETPRKAQVASIDSIEVIDDLTVRVTFSTLKCDGLLDLGLGWLPSHLYAEDFSDIMDSPLNTAPTVTADAFRFKEWQRDNYIAMESNDGFWKGAPNMDGQIIRVIPESSSRLASLENGEIDVMGLEPTQLTRVELNPDLNLFKFKDDGYTYIGLNQANPANPLPGQDEDGNLVEQDPHPILSDKMVRKAMAHSLDYEAIIDKVWLGQGYKMASNVLPAVGWAHDASIEPYAYDPEAAAALLNEAGWTDSDGDGVRECNGCATAEAGVTLSLSLVTNAGNSTREELGVLVQDQLNSIGFNIEFEALEWGTLVGELFGQSYEMVIIGWTGVGTDPNDDTIWHSRFDTPGSGFNFVSFQNPRVDELLELGLATPGCAAEDRAPHYYEIQQIIHDELPYLFVTGSIGNIGYSNRWEGIDPGPWSFSWNIHEWALAE